jgi:prepilin-type N-terminal cleavage/methylation domain-containing protein
MNATRRRTDHSAFTLVELLVVMAIIGVLLAMLLPGVQGMREAARRSTCQNNVVRIMIALGDHQSAKVSLPAGVIAPKGPIENDAAGSHHSWLEQILPYMDESNLFRHIDPAVAVFDPKNDEARKFHLPVFTCPSEPLDERSASSYAGCHHDVEAPIDADNHGVLFLNSHVTSDDITDGSAHTIFVGEKQFDTDDLGWMSGTRATLRNTGHRINPAPARPRLAQTNEKPAEGSEVLFGPGEAAEKVEVPTETVVPVAEDRISEDPAAALLRVGGFSSSHAGGAVFGLGDGSVQFISDEIDPSVLEKLGNRSDGGLVDDPLVR